ncbi:MAG TPA: glycosyltransferase [Saprospiraceae bacterium]|nr:glycosyltransferase [Saprospiraceae bacterium]HNT22339.1 glycosyltransferase [Saprospiraceae bacterium]
MGQDVLKSNRYLHFLSKTEAANLITVSEFQNECLVQSVGFPAGKCIPWGLAREDMPAAFPDQRPVDVLGCGSLIPVKNWNLWLEVLAMLVRWNPALKAEIIGDGPERKRLEEQIWKNKLERNISLTGTLPRPLVLKKMSISRVFLHTSGYESFGYVLAEAAANGCHVVSTPVGIARDLASCANTAEALFNHVARLLVLPPPAGKVPVKTMEEVAAEYLDLYKNCKKAD